MPTFNYKIRNKDGLFSSGGDEPTFEKLGKVWKTLGHISLHIANLSKAGRKTYKEPGIEVVEYEMVERSTTSIDVAIKRQQDSRAKREEQERLARDRRREKFKASVGKSK